MESLIRLPKVETNIGANGVCTSPLVTFPPPLQKNHPSNKPSSSLASLNGSGQVLTAEEIKSRFSPSIKRSQPSPRPWKTGTGCAFKTAYLSLSWLPTLERICEELDPGAVHRDFGLWLTSEPSPHFPAFVLQNGCTVEPPKGMRASLNGSWNKIEEDWFESCAQTHVFKKLMFGLTFLHATLIERRKFGPLGWNVKYVFSDPVMSICMGQLLIFLNDLEPGAEEPYAALAYLAGECNYGGRCTDDKDRRCLVNIISEFYNPSILDDDHKFSPSGTYFAPPEGNLQSYRDYIDTLPFSEGPEVFGLHDNANISCAVAETNMLLDTMQSLQPQTGGGEGKSWDQILAELAVDIAAKIPEKYDIEVALLDFPVLYEECMNTVLVQELIRFNRVIGTVASSLKEVQRAVKGLVVMSGDLEAMGNSMVIGKVCYDLTILTFNAMQVAQHMHLHTLTYPLNHFRCPPCGCGWRIPPSSRSAGG